MATTAPEKSKRSIARTFEKPRSRSNHMNIPCSITERLLYQGAGSTTASVRTRRRRLSARQDRKRPSRSFPPRLQRTSEENPAAAAQRDTAMILSSRMGRKVPFVPVSGNRQAVSACPKVPHKLTCHRHRKARMNNAGSAARCAEPTPNLTPIASECMERCNG